MEGQCLHVDIWENYKVMDGKGHDTLLYPFPRNYSIDSFHVDCCLPTSAKLPPFSTGRLDGTLEVGEESHCYQCLEGEILQRWKPNVKIVAMKRLGSECRSKNDPRRTKRERMHAKNVMPTENLMSSTAPTQSNIPQLPGFPAKNEEEEAPRVSDVNIFVDEEVNTGAKIAGDQGKQAADERSLRERLQRYRVQIAGNVWIPERWEQEDRLKEWIDPKAMDAALVPNGLMSARIALIEDCRARDQPKGVSMDLKGVGDRQTQGICSSGLSVGCNNQNLQNTSHFSQ